MALTLGFEPYQIEVILARDAQFTSEIVADEPWPDGIVVELRFSVSDTGTPVVWPADVGEVPAALTLAGQLYQIVAERRGW